MQLLIQCLRVLPFLFVGGQPILSEDDVVSHRQGKYSRSTRCDFAPAELSSFVDTREDTRPPRLTYCRRRIQGTSQYKFSAEGRQAENRPATGAVPSSYLLQLPQRWIREWRPGYEARRFGSE